MKNGNSAGRRPSGRRKRRRQSHRRSVMMISIVLLLLCGVLTVNSVTLQAKNDSYKEQEKDLTEQIEEQKARAEEIKEYEEDIAAGKDVTIKDYVNKDKVNYENNISKLGLDLSYLIENAFNKGMNAFFNMLNEAISS